MLLFAISVLLPVALVPVAMTVPENGTRPHEDEIRIFADTAALAEAASNHCPDILINRTLMTALNEQMHVRPMDAQAVQEQAQTAADALTKEIAGASSPQAWCDAIYKLYGPDGTALPKLMLRR